MAHADFVLSHLRTEVGSLQSLLSYLEERDAIERTDYAYLSAKLREVIGRLRDMEQLSKRWGIDRPLLAEWLN